MWIRHVCIPTVNDCPDDWRALGAFMATLPTVKALDVLPYHTLGVNKYEEMGLTYPLKDLPAATNFAWNGKRNNGITTIVKGFFFLRWFCF